MLKTNKKVPKNELQKALEACERANLEGYSIAKKHLESIKKSIDKATKIIADCINNLKEHNINDEKIIQEIKNQLKSVQDEFNKTYFNTKENIEEKRKTSSKFNITLFGRTKTGKSTLMEILTHGDGSHIGKGGQRTTRDVRSYEWKGMNITDVPGIDAYNGEEDDKKAEEAAIYADLILFMITAGQPEGTEADWLIKLKKMDKPIICICNFKQSIGEGVDDIRLKRLLNNPDKINERMNISELVQQFNTFLQEQLPNEHVDFIVTHLLSKFASQQKEYVSKSKELNNISRFYFIEKSLINEVNNNGVLYRKKCYLSIIDAPLYQQMNKLFEFSSNAYSLYKIIQEKISQFEDWYYKFNNNQKENLENFITQEYNKIRNSIPGFVERHLQDEDVAKAWSNHCNRFPIQNNIENHIKKIQDKLEEKISDIFSELDVEMKFSLNWQTEKENYLGNYRFTDWKRVWNWTSAISSAGLAIASILLSSGPIGWVAGGVAAIFTFFSWICDSRESKLKERRIKLTNRLNKSLFSAERKHKKEVNNWFYNSIIKQEYAISNKLNIIGKSMLSLSNSERELALNYIQNHKDISKMMIANIFYSVGIPMTEFDRIYCVARIPGKRIAIVIIGEENLHCKIADLVQKLGNKEKINIIKLKRNAEKSSQIYNLLRYFGITTKPLIKEVNNGKQTIVYLHNNNYNNEQLDSLNLIQQTMNVHIIIK